MPSNRDYSKTCKINDKQAKSDVAYSNIENDSLLKSDKFIKEELMNNERVRRSIDSIYDSLERKLNK